MLILTGSHLRFSAAERVEAKVCFGVAECARTPEVLFIWYEHVGKDIFQIPVDRTRDSGRSKSADWLACRRETQAAYQRKGRQLSLFLSSRREEISPVPGAMIGRLKMRKVIQRIAQF